MRLRLSQTNATPPGGGGGWGGVYENDLHGSDINLALARETQALQQSFRKVQVSPQGNYPHTARSKEASSKKLQQLRAPVPNIPDAFL